jgi:hypothetical protein
LKIKRGGGAREEEESSERGVCVLILDLKMLKAKKMR